MPRSRATWATGCPDSRTNRTASSLNASVYDRRVFVLILSSNFIILPLMEVSVKSGEGHLTLASRGLATASRVEASHMTDLWGLILFCA
jgi:hypothetical protein